MENRKKSTRRIELPGKRTVVAGDFHFPYHHPDALKLFLAFIRWLKPETIMLNGDNIDFYALSAYDKDPKRLLSLQYELDTCLLQLLRPLRSINKDMRIIFHSGNHEFRLDKYLQRHPEISSLRALAISKILEFDKLRIEYLPYEDRIQFGSFHVWHGDKTSPHSGYTAAKYARDWRVNGIFNHIHRMGTHYVTSVGQEIVCHENGCMCIRDPEYVKGGVPNWQLGFGVIEHIGKMDFYQPIHIQEHGNHLFMRYNNNTFRTEY